MRYLLIAILVSGCTVKDGLRVVAAGMSPEAAAQIRAEQHAERVCKDAEDYVDCYSRVYKAPETMTCERRYDKVRCY